MNEKKEIKKRIKRIIKKLYILILFIALLMVTTSVHAGTKDSVLIRNKQNDIFAIAPLSDRTHLYYLEMYTINNIPTYCIELGKKITTTTYNSTTDREEQKKLTKLTNAQLDFINLVSYFGYNYKENGKVIHTEREYYMATQEIIWEYLSDYNISWTNIEDINGPKINIDKYIKEIFFLMNKYNATLNIPNEVNVKVGDKISYKDSNLSIYKITNDSNKIGNINNDELKLNIPNNYIGTTKITLDINNYTNDINTIYNIDDSQLLLSRGKIPNKSKEITINVEGKTLTTNLIDKETKSKTPQGQATLEGAVYELYDKDKKLVTTFTTDNTLTNTIPNLNNEKYYIKQIKASKGYKINENLIEVDLSKNNNITLEEEVIKCKVEIIKLYEIDNELKREENIEFSFNYFKNSTGYFGSIITTKEGPDTIILPYGNYRITQNNTTYGYDKINTKYLEIATEQEKPIIFTFTNKKITTKLNITTKDKITNNKIEETGIKYKIKNSQNEYLQYKNNNKIENEFYTDNSGELLLPFELPYGTYYIEQINPPQKYLKSNEIIKVEINENTNYIKNISYLLVNVDYYNIPIKGKINISTIKEETIDGKTTISNRPNIEIYLYKNNKLIDKVTTNEEGIITIDNLELDNYCIKEKNKEAECIEFVVEDNTKDIIEKNITIKEEIIKNSNIPQKENNEEENTITNKSVGINNERISIPNTLSNKKINYKSLFLLIILIGAIIYKKIIKYNHNNNHSTTFKRRINK